MVHMDPTESQAQMVDRDRMDSKMYQQTNRNGALIVQRHRQDRQAALDRLDKEAYEVHPEKMDKMEHRASLDQLDLRDRQEDPANQDSKAPREHQDF